MWQCFSHSVYVRATVRASYRLYRHEHPNSASTVVLARLEVRSPYLINVCEPVAGDVSSSQCYPHGSLTDRRFARPGPPGPTPPRRPTARPGEPSETAGAARAAPPAPRVRRRSRGRARARAAWLRDGRGYYRTREGSAVRDAIARFAPPRPGPWTASPPRRDADGPRRRARCPKPRTRGRCGLCRMRKQSPPTRFRQRQGQPTRGIARAHGTRTTSATSSKLLYRTRVLSVKLSSKYAGVIRGTMLTLLRTSTVWP